MTALLCTDSAALLAAVRAAPDDDAPRLVYADWLEEHGQPEWAEFVRVQVELARVPDSYMHKPTLRDNGDRGRELVCNCRVCNLRYRERGLLNSHWVEWCRGLAPPQLSDVPVFARGFVASVTLTTPLLMGGECEECDGQGSLIGDPECTSCHGAGRVVDPDSEYADDTMDCDDCDRVDCPACHCRGRTPGLAAQIGKACPGLERVVLSDREPYPNNNSEFSWWDATNARRDHPQSDLPRELYKLLNDGDDADIFTIYPTRDLALSALARAAADYCRGS